MKHRTLRILSAGHVSDGGRTWQSMSTSAFKLQNGRSSWCMWYDGMSSYARGTLGLMSESTSFLAAAQTSPDLGLLDQDPEPLILHLTDHKLDTIQSIFPYPYDSNIRSHHPGLHEAYRSIFDPSNQSANSTTASQHDLSLEFNHEDRIQHYEMDHLRAHYEYAKKVYSLECHSDSYFSAIDGGFGLCPQTARKDDVIIVLHGGSVLYNLREQSHRLSGESPKLRYEFISECYLENWTP